MKSKILTIILTVLLTSTTHAQNTPANQQDLSQFSAYSESIKNCTKGTYTLPTLAAVAFYKTANPNTPIPPTIQPMTYEIIGWQAGKCQVKITQVAPAADGSASKSVVVNCMIAAGDLPTVSASAAKMASGNASFTTADPANHVMQSACAMAHQ